MTEIKPGLQSTVPLDRGLTLHSFLEAQFFVFRSERLYLVINAMLNGQNGNGGHCHNDKLSIELSLDGEDVYVDPGCYTYTACPKLRNLFRSVRYHNTPVHDNLEQNNWKEGISGLFSMANDSVCRVLELRENFISIYLKYREIEQVRQVLVNPFSIHIKDFSNLAFTSHFNDFKLYSNGYGKLVNFKVLEERIC